MTYMPNLESIFVSGTYLAITCEVEVVVGSILPCWVYELYLEWVATFVQ